MPPPDDRIAARAADLFHEHGITSTGVDALSKAAGISKRTLYERFGSKDGLIVAAYDSLDLPVFELLTGPAEAASTTPRGQLDALFVQLEAMVELPEFRGCPFTNAAVGAVRPGARRARDRASAQGAAPPLDPRAPPRSGSREPGAAFAAADARLRRRTGTGARPALAAPGSRRAGRRARPRRRRGRRIELEPSRDLRRAHVLLSLGHP